MKQVVIADGRPESDDVEAIIVAGNGKKTILSFYNGEGKQVQIIYDDANQTMSIKPDASTESGNPCLTIFKNGRIQHRGVNSFSSEQAAKDQGYVEGQEWMLNNDGILRIIRAD